MLGRGSPSLQARSTPTLRSARGVHVSRNGSVVIGGTQAALPPAAAASTPVPQSGARSVRVSRHGSISIAPRSELARSSQPPLPGATPQPPPRPASAVGATPLRHRLRDPVVISPSADEAMDSTGSFADGADDDYRLRQEDADRRRRRAESNRVKRRQQQRPSSALRSEQSQVQPQPQQQQSEEYEEYNIYDSNAAEPAQQEAATDAEIDADHASGLPAFDFAEVEHALDVVEELKSQIAEIASLRERIVVGATSIDRHIIGAAGGRPTPVTRMGGRLAQLDRVRAAHEHEVAELSASYRREVAELNAQLSAAPQSQPQQQPPPPPQQQQFSSPTQQPLPPRRPPSHPTPPSTGTPSSSRTQSSTAYAEDLRSTLRSLRRGLCTCGTKQLRLVLSHFGTANAISEPAFAVGVLTAAGIAAGERSRGLASVRSVDAGAGVVAEQQQHEQARAFLGLLYRAVAAFSESSSEVSIEALMRGVAAFVFIDAAATARAIIAAANDEAWETRTISTMAPPLSSNSAVARTDFILYMRLACVVLPVYQHMQETRTLRPAPSQEEGDEALTTRLRASATAVEGLAAEFFEAPELQRSLTPLRRRRRKSELGDDEYDDVAIAGDIFERWYCARCELEPEDGGTPISLPLPFDFLPSAVTGENERAGIETVSAAADAAAGMEMPRQEVQQVQQQAPPQVSTPRATPLPTARASSKMNLQEEPPRAETPSKWSAPARHFAFGSSSFDESPASSPSGGGAASKSSSGSNNGDESSSQRNFSSSSRMPEVFRVNGAAAATLRSGLRQRGVANVLHILRRAATHRTATTTGTPWRTARALVLGKTSFVLGLLEAARLPSNDDTLSSQSAAAKESSEVGWRTEEAIAGCIHEAFFERCRGTIDSSDDVPFLDLAAGAVALLAGEEKEEQSRTPSSSRLFFDGRPSPACAAAFELYDPHGEGMVGRFEIAHFAEAWSVATAAVEAAVLDRPLDASDLSARWRAAAEQCRLRADGTVTVEAFNEWFQRVLVGGARAAALGAAASVLPLHLVEQSLTTSDLVDTAQLLMLPPPPREDTLPPSPPRRPAPLALHRPLRNVAPVRTRDVLCGVPVAAGRATDLLSFNRRPVTFRNAGSPTKPRSTTYSMSPLSASTIIVDRAIAHGSAQQRSRPRGGGRGAGSHGLQRRASAQTSRRRSDDRATLEAEVAALKFKLAEGSAAARYE